MRIVIFGCGRMGSALARMLSRSHHSVIVVDHDQQAFLRLGPDFSGTMILKDALDKDSFTAGTVDKVDGLAAVTGSDTVNITIARAARQIFQVPKVVARIHDPRHAEIYRHLGVQTVINVDLGVVRISELLTFSNLEITHSLGNGKVNIVALEISPLLSGHAVREISVPGEIQVIALTRNGKTNIPTLDSRFQIRDILHIAVEDHSVSRLKELIGVS